MLLNIDQIFSGYGAISVLFGISLKVDRGEAIALIGRNGMGKSTIIRTLMGLNEPTGGSIVFSGREIAGASPYRICKAGVGFVPEGRKIFPNLTVRENLLMAYHKRSDRKSWTLDRVLSLFPRLSERLAIGGCLLSGGEQQMLAIGRALMTNPSLLVLDEATEGLAPVICDEIWQTLRLLKDDGVSMIIVDKDIESLDAVVDGFYVLEKGTIVASGRAPLRAQRKAIDEFLSVG
jgi:branched-chain amino acid transport system ATP-binding protein